MTFKWFSFSWLKSKERKELEQLRAEKARRTKLLDEVLRPALKDLQEEIENTRQEVNEFPYSQLYFTGNSITVITHENDIWTVTGDKELYFKVKECKTKDEIFNLLFEKPFSVTKFKEEVLEEEEEEYEQIMKEVKETFTLHPDFEEKDGKMYLKGVNLPLPTYVKSSFLEIIEKKELNKMKGNTKNFEEEFEALKMFWCKLALNPIASAREDLLRFIRLNKIQITNTGNFIGYRRIVSVNTKVNKKKVTDISSLYFKVKGWKKSPKNFEIWDENNLIQIGKTHNFKTKVGNLKELYDNLSNMDENRFTDNHTRKYDIRIGSVYKIQPEHLDLKHYYKSCGGALHISDGRNFTYDSFGDTPVVCIINPMHVVKMDTGTTGKIGVSEMFIAAKSEFKNGKFVDVDDKNIVHFDDEYNKITLNDLLMKLENNNIEQFSVKENKIKLVIEEVKDIATILKNRTKKIL